MKLLLSAFACEPNFGSEPGVGWNWAIELAGLGLDVWVLTSTSHERAIEREAALAPRTNLHFLYFDLPAWLTWWKKGRRGVHLHYLLWQWGAYRYAKRLHERIGFDRVHHVTYAAIRQPSFMGGLGIPFIFGPVGGGERAPMRMRRGFGYRAQIAEAIRDLSNILVRIDPFMRRTFRQAKTIYTTTQQSRNAIPRRRRFKTEVQLPIGADSTFRAAAPPIDPTIWDHLRPSNMLAASSSSNIRL